jgi:hypothetical protein
MKQLRDSDPGNCFVARMVTMAEELSQESYECDIIIIRASLVAEHHETLM